MRDAEKLRVKPSLLAMEKKEQDMILQDAERRGRRRSRGMAGPLVERKRRREPKVKARRLRVQAAVCLPSVVRGVRGRGS